MTHFNIDEDYDLIITSHLKTGEQISPPYAKYNGINIILIMTIGVTHCMSILQNNMKFMPLQNRKYVYYSRSKQKLGSKVLSVKIANVTQNVMFDKPLLLTFETNLVGLHTYTS